MAPDPSALHRDDDLRTLPLGDATDIVWYRDWPTIVVGILIATALETAVLANLFALRSIAGLMYYGYLGVVAFVIGLDVTARLKRRLVGADDGYLALDHECLVQHADEHEITPLAAIEQIAWERTRRHDRFKLHLRRQPPEQVLDAATLLRLDAGTHDAEAGPDTPPATPGDAHRPPALAPMNDPASPDPHDLDAAHDAEYIVHADEHAITEFVRMLHDRVEDARARRCTPAARDRRELLGLGLRGELEIPNQRATARLTADHRGVEIRRRGSLTRHLPWRAVKAVYLILEDPPAAAGPWTWNVWIVRRRAAFFTLRKDPYTLPFRFTHADPRAGIALRNHLESLRAAAAETPPEVTPPRPHWLAP